MKKKKFLISILLACCIVFNLVGCTKNDTALEGETDVDVSKEVDKVEKVATGDDDYLVWNMETEVKTFDPTMNTASIAYAVILQLFEGLTYTSATGEDGIEPGVAKTWDVSDDGLVYTFHLREDAKWSDGSPLTAHDFEYSWKRVCDPEVVSDNLQGMTDYIVGAKEYFDGTGTRDDVKIKAVDDYTFEVELINPTPFFPQLVAGGTYMPVQEATVEKNGEGWEKNPETFISNGAFILEEYEIGSHYKFKKNEEYWDADNVKLAGIKAIFVNDSNTSLQGYQAGDIDATELMPAEEIPRLLAEDPNFKSGLRTGCFYLGFNVDREPMNDVNVRKAITLAIDRKQLVEQVTKSGEIPASGFIAPTALKTDGSSYRELDENGFPEVAYEINPYQAEVEKAQEYLAKAGYPNGENFPTLEMAYDTSDYTKKIMESIQEMLKENLNISTTLRNEDSSVFSDTRTKGDFHIAWCRWTTNPMDAGGLIKQFHSQNGNNATQWRWKEYVGAPWDTTLNPGNKPFDEAFDRAMASQGKERDQAWVEAEQALMADMPMAPLFYPTKVYVVNEERVKGVQKNNIIAWIFKNAEMVK